MTIWIIYRIETCGGGHGEGGPMSEIEFQPQFFRDEDRAKQCAERLNKDDYWKWNVKELNG